MTDIEYWVDGMPGTTVSAANRALQYGDGLFETIRIRDFRPEFLDCHLNRLMTGCERLGFPVVDRDALKRELLERASRHQHAVLKIILSRGSDGRGYRADPGQNVSSIVSVYPLTSWFDKPDINGIQVRICDIRLAIQPALAGIKHLNRLEQVLARGEWDDPAIAEGLMLDTEGQLIEATMSNIFLVHDNVLITPELSRCGVAGVMRSVILEQAKRQGIETQVLPVSLQQLEDVQEIFVCNSLIGIWPVVQVNGLREFSIGRITRQLQVNLKEQLNSFDVNWYAS